MLFRSVNPDTARFSCDTNGDCGSGFECRPQALQKRGLCYKIGQCADELCDGHDNDCNGLIDDGFDLTSDAVNCGSCGTACALGTDCIDSRCIEVACADTLDNDGNGASDCADTSCLGRACDLTDGGVNCGRFPADGGALDDGGFGARGCVARETDCADSLDNDGDGRADCADLDCEGEPCDSGGGSACRAGVCLH